MTIKWYLIKKKVERIPPTEQNNSLEKENNNCLWERFMLHVFLSKGEVGIGFLHGDGVSAELF